MQNFFRAINRFYLDNPALWEIDFSWEGFEWLVPDDNENNVVVFLRRDKKGNELVCVVNFSPNPYEGYRFGVPGRREYEEVFNTDRPEFGGSGWNYNGTVKCERIASHGREASIAVKIPPYGALFLRGSGKLPAERAARAKKAVKTAETPKAAASKTAKATKTAKAAKTATTKKTARAAKAKKTAKTK